MSILFMTTLLSYSQSIYNFWLVDLDDQIIDQVDICGGETYKFKIKNLTQGAFGPTTPDLVVIWRFLDVETGFNICPQKTTNMVYENDYACSYLTFTPDENCQLQAFAFYNNNSYASAENNTPFLVNRHPALGVTPLVHSDGYTSFGFFNGCANGTAPYSLTWEYSDCLGDHSVSDYSIYPTGLISYAELQITDANGCTAGWIGGQSAPEIVASATIGGKAPLFHSKYTGSVTNATGPVTYKWNWYIPTGFKQVYGQVVQIPNNATNIILTVTQGDCSDTWTPSSAKSVEFSIEENKEISVYPNPASSTLNIESSSNEISVEIYNVLSQKVLSVENTKNIDINALENGNYIVKITSQGQTTIKKFVKQ